MTKNKKVTITLKKSLSGRIPAHIETVKGLGLRRIGQMREVELNPSMAGMVNQVSYLLKVEPLQ